MAKRLVKEGPYVFIAGRWRAELDKAVALIGNVKGHDLSKMLGILHDLWHEFSTAVFETQLLNRFVPSIECTGKINVGMRSKSIGGGAVNSLRGGVS